MIERLLRPEFASPRRLALAATGVVAVFTLAACGGSASGSGAPAQSSAAPSTSASGSRAGSGPGSGSPGTGGGPGGQFAPAASGKVAAITGTTMQVQSQQNGQVAVAWSASTKFSHTVSLALASVKPGDCVLAMAPQGTSASANSFTARTLVVSSPVNGSCTRGIGQRPGGNRSGQRPSGQRPSGSRPSGSRPSGFPSGRAGGRAGFGAIADGTVSSVSGSKIVVAAQQRGSSSSSTSDKTITVGTATKISTDAATTSHSVQVGKCVTARGKADSSGTVAATNVQITDPTNGQCGGGFGGFGRRTNGG